MTIKLGMVRLAYELGLPGGWWVKAGVYDLRSDGYAPTPHGEDFFDDVRKQVHDNLLLFAPGNQYMEHNTGESSHGLPCEYGDGPVAD